MALFVCLVFVLNFPSPEEFYLFYTPFSFLFHLLPALGIELTRHSTTKHQPQAVYPATPSFPAFISFCSCSCNVAAVLSVFHPEEPGAGAQEKTTTAFEMIPQLKAHGKQDVTALKVKLTEGKSHNTTPPNHLWGYGLFRS